MTIASGNFAELLWPGINTLWGESYNDYEPLYTKIFNVKKSNKRFEKEQGVTGLGLASVKNEGNAISYDDPFQGFQQEYVNVTYSTGAIVTREMYEDDMYDYINGLPGMLARSMRQTEETIAFQHINRGFNASFTGADGSTLFNTAHTNVDGSTWSNRLATDSDLTQTAMEQQLQDIMDAVDDRQLKIRLMPKCLVVPTQLNFQARKILESYGIIGSANNDVNGIPGMFEDLVVSPYLTDVDAWFVVTNAPHGFTWYNRRPAEIARDNEFDTENLKFKTSSRFSSNWTDARCAWGTPGA